MAYPTSITLADTTPTDHIYVDLGGAFGRRKIRKEVAAPADQPKHLIVDHTETGKGLKTLTRSVVRNEQVFEDSITGEQVTGYIQTIVGFYTKVATTQQMQDLMSEHKAFLNTSGYSDDLIAGNS